MQTNYFFLILTEQVFGIFGGLFKLNLKNISKEMYLRVRIHTSSVFYFYI